MLINRKNTTSIQYPQNVRFDILILNNFRIHIWYSEMEKATMLRGYHIWKV